MIDILVLTKRFCDTRLIIVSLCIIALVHKRVALYVRALVWIAKLCARVRVCVDGSVCVCVRERERD